MSLYVRRYSNSSTIDILGDLTDEILLESDK